RLTRQIHCGEVLELRHSDVPTQSGLRKERTHEPRVLTELDPRSSRPRCGDYSACCSSLSRMTQLSFAFAMIAALAACKKKPTEQRAEPPKGSAEVAAGDAAPASGPAVDAAPAAWDGKSPLKVDGFSTPESVLYDADGDVYLVSNINGKPAEADDNGF